VDLTSTKTKRLFKEEYVWVQQLRLVAKNYKRKHLENFCPKLYNCSSEMVEKKLVRHHKFTSRDQSEANKKTQLYARGKTCPWELS